MTRPWAWIRESPRNRKVLAPYLNGEDLNSRPDCSASRWVINFSDESERTAKTYSEPFARIEHLVLPERRSASKPVADSNWWQFLRTRPAMRKAISGLDEVLVIARISKTVMPVRVPNRCVFNEKTCVFATQSFADQAVLSSSLHQTWVIKY